MVLTRYFLCTSGTAVWSTNVTSPVSGSYSGGSRRWPGRSAQLPNPDPSSSAYWMWGWDQIGCSSAPVPFLQPVLSPNAIDNLSNDTVSLTARSVALTAMLTCVVPVGMSNVAEDFDQVVELNALPTSV